MAGEIVAVEYSHHGDGTVDGSITAPAANTAFTYDPRASEPGLIALPLIGAGSGGFNQEQAKALIHDEGWVLLPPGDAALTRRVKAAGDHWIVPRKTGPEGLLQRRVGGGGDH